MQGIKISHVGRIFALAAPSDSRGRHNGRSKKTKEERRVMIVSFVEKYKASNKGKFPPVTLTHKVVGGTYYTVREILQELKQENISCDTLGTDLEATETKNQTRHTVEPLSLPADSANDGVTGNRHSLEHKEANYRETLSDTEERKIVIHNDVLETCGVNNQTQANEESKIVGRPLGSNPTSFVVDLQPLQGLTKGQYISSVSNGAINSNHHLELSRALSDTEEQGNIIHNDVVEICDPNDQTQKKKKEIKIGERPLRTSAASGTMDLQDLPQVMKGQISSAGTGVRDNNHRLALNEAEYLEVLSDTEEQKNSIHNDVMRTFGRNDQTQAKQDIKIVKRPQGASVASVVVGVHPPQEMMEGQSISSLTGAVMDNNHILEINDAKYQEALSDTEEQKNIIHNDVETCGPNDQTQVKQEITIIESSPGTSAASSVMGLQPLHDVTKEQAFEKEEKNQQSSFKLDENQKNKSTHEKEIVFQISETATNRNVIESYSSSVESGKCEVPEVKKQEYNLTHDMNSSASISLDMCLPELQSSELGPHSLENQHMLGSLEELEHALPPLSEEGSMFGTQKITYPCSPLENNSSCIEYHEGGEDHLHLDTSKPLSLSSDSHSTTCVTKQPKDLSFSAQNEDDNALVINSTKRIAEEPEIPDDKIISPTTDSVTAPQEASEIPDNILDDKKLASLNISPDQVLTGVKAFYQVLLHRLALSALVVKTLVHAGDASQKGSSELQSENSDGYSFSKYCIDLPDKKETASVVSSSSLDQGGSIRDTVQSTQKTNSDGYCKSEKTISSYQGESTGDMMQISQNFSDGNCTTVENKNRTHKYTKSSKDREKLETNMILDFVNNIVKGILYLLKK